MLLLRGGSRCRSSPCALEGAGCPAAAGGSGISVRPQRPRGHPPHSRSSDLGHDVSGRQEHRHKPVRRNPARRAQRPWQPGWRSLREPGIGQAADVWRASAAAFSERCGQVGRLLRQDDRRSPPRHPGPRCWNRLYGNWLARCALKSRLLDEALESAARTLGNRGRAAGRRDGAPRQGWVSAICGALRNSGGRRDKGPARRGSHGGSPAGDPVTS